MIPAGPGCPGAPIGPTGPWKGQSDVVTYQDLIWLDNAGW